MEKSKSIFSIDLVLLLSTIALMLIGVLFIYSSGANSPHPFEEKRFEYIRQIVWMTLGIILLIVFSLADYNILKEMSFYIYIFFMVILLLTLFFGKVVNGSKSWFGFLGFGIQPSEFSKIATILFLARFCHDNRSRLKEIQYFLLALTIILVPMALILRQPDLGTALVFIPVFLVITFLAGARPRHLFFLLLTLSLVIFLTIATAYAVNKGTAEDSIFDLFVDYYLFGIVSLSLLIIGVLGFFGFRKYKVQVFYWITYFSTILLVSFAATFALRFVLKGYQISRLILFLDPSIDPKGDGWNLTQAITAVGSGGFWGKGFLQGTQSQNKFVPMQSTDFIFSIVAEEWGFIGGLIIFGLFSLILLRSLSIMSQVKDKFAIYTIGGILGMFFTHVFVNIGMTMGIMPITGIPLHFLSYGGSSLIAGALAIGIVLNIHQRRFRV